MITINGREIDVDIRVELEQYEWIKPIWKTDKLLAASPFRYDRNPSFFVSLEHGGWKDSGAVDSEWDHGGFVKLLSFLRHETYTETSDYLLMRYDSCKEYDYGKLSVKLSTLSRDTVYTPLDDSILNGFKFRHPYLGQRGITEAVQRMFKIGYDKQSKAVTIPWFTADGRLANVKYRRTDSKIFWYQKGGMPLRGLVYGMDRIYKGRIEQAVLVEGEVDALWLWTANIPAIAIGGSAFTDEKADLIRRSSIERLLIATDNDAVGRKIREEVKRKLAGEIELADLDIPEMYKDINDIPTLEEVQETVGNTLFSPYTCIKLSLGK